MNFFYTHCIVLIFIFFCTPFFPTVLWWSCFWVLLYCRRGSVLRFCSRCRLHVDIQLIQIFIFILFCNQSVRFVDIIFSGSSPFSGQGWRKSSKNIGCHAQCVYHLLASLFCHRTAEAVQCQDSIVDRPSRIVDWLFK